MADNKKSGRKKKNKRIITGIIILDIVVALIFVGALIWFIKIKNTEENSGKKHSSSISTETTEEDIVVSTEELNPESVAEKDNQEETGTAEPDDNIDAAVATKVEDKLTSMSLHEKVCQLFIITPEAATGFNLVTQTGDTSKQAYDEYPVCGYIYFSQNLETVDQTHEMLTNIRQYAEEHNGIPFFTGVDEEGGVVARCADKLGTTSFLPMYEYRDEGEETANNNAFTIGFDISELGFNLDFAPVADTWSNSVNTVIGDRAYSTDYEEAATLVAAAVRGFNDSGVVCCLKHFPGHGDTAEDSHKSAAYLRKTLEESRNTDFLPFKSGIDAGAGMVMVGHLYLSDEDIVNEADKVPASLNSKVIDYELRQVMGYDGVVITDALNMGAISNYYTSGDAVKLSIKAGADIMLMPEDFKSAVAALEEAVESGEIPETRIDESVRRILTLKYSLLQ